VRRQRWAALGVGLVLFLAALVVAGSRDSAGDQPTPMPSVSASAWPDPGWP